MTSVTEVSNNNKEKGVSVGWWWESRKPAWSVGGMVVKDLKAKREPRREVTSIVL